MRSPAGLDLADGRPGHLGDRADRGEGDLAVEGGQLVEGEGQEEVPAHDRDDVAPQRVHRRPSPAVHPRIDHVVVEEARRVDQLRRHGNMEERGLRCAGGQPEQVHHSRADPLATAADAEVTAGVEERVRLAHLARAVREDRGEAPSVASRNRAASGVVSIWFTLFKTT
jgi:hypothetical protein